VLVPVLEAVTPPGQPLYAVYPSSRQLPPKVRAFLDMLAERRAALPWEESAAPVSPSRPASRARSS
jgi:DNA-binding transcriptional LysR family regulator